MTWLRALLESRRFWAAVSGVIVVVLHDSIGIDETAANTIATLIISWIVGESLRSSNAK